MNASRSSLHVTILLALAGAVGVTVFVSRRDSAQRAQMDALSRELGAVRAALADRGERSPPPFPAYTSLAPPAVDTDAVVAGVAAKLRAERPQVATTAPVPTAAPAETPAQRAAAERATALVDRAIGAGHLRRDDVMEMRRNLAAARPQDGSELARRIAVALNTNQLVPEDDNFIFP